MPLGLKHEERVIKISFLARHYFKADIVIFIYLVNICENDIGLY